MTKTIIGVVAVLVVVGGYVLIRNSDTKEVQGTPTAEDISSTTPASSNGKKMAFSSFLKNDQGSYQCTVKQYMDDFGSEGTVYISAGKIRGEFTTTAEGKLIETSLIVTDGYQYIWSSAMQGGFKMKIPDIATSSASTNTETTGTYYWNAEQIGDYDCVPWTTEESKFIPPVTIVFTDMSTALPRQ